MLHQRCTCISVLLRSSARNGIVRPPLARPHQSPHLSAGVCILAQVMDLLDAQLQLLLKLVNLHATPHRAAAAAARHRGDVTSLT